MKYNLQNKILKIGKRKRMNGRGWASFIPVLDISHDLSLYLSLYFNVNLYLELGWAFIPMPYITRVLYLYLYLYLYVQKNEWQGLGFIHSDARY